VSVFFEVFNSAGDRLFFEAIKIGLNPFFGNGISISEEDGVGKMDQEIEPLKVVFALFRPSAVDEGGDPVQFNLIVFEPRTEWEEAFSWIFAAVREDENMSCVAWRKREFLAEFGEGCRDLGLIHGFFDRGFMGTGDDDVDGIAIGIEAPTDKVSHQVGSMTFACGEKNVCARVQNGL